MIIGVLHGSNLNRLGQRNPAKYGRATLADISHAIDERGTEVGFEALHFQSNHEGLLVDWVHENAPRLDGIVINPAGFSSGGYPLLDALLDSDLPLAVVHISPFPALDGRTRADIFASEATIYITGAGWRGYLYAAEAIAHVVQRS